MTSTTYVLLSGVLTYGIPLALAIRELLSLPKSERRGDDWPPEEPFVRGPKPLPDCLLPPRSPASGPARVRLRVLEDA